MDAIVERALADQSIASISEALTDLVDAYRHIRGDGVDRTDATSLLTKQLSDQLTAMMSAGLLAVAVAQLAESDGRN